MTPDEYLAWERDQRDKHQSLGGEVDEVFEGAFDLPGDEPVT